MPTKKIIIGILALLTFGFVALLFLYPDAASSRVEEARDDGDIKSIVLPAPAAPVEGAATPLPTGAGLTREQLLEIQQPTRTTGVAVAKYAVPILFFHHVASSDGVPDKDKGLFYPPENFEILCKYLKEHGYTTYPFSVLESGKALPEKSAILTFDDGYADHATIALPILQKYGLTGTFFVISGMVGADGYVTEAQVKALSAAGMEIGSHTVSHADLSRISPEKLHKEVWESKKYLEDLIGLPITTFCYPSGKYNAAVLDEVRKAGYVLARTVKRGFTEDMSKPLEVVGVRVLPSAGLKSFENWFPGG